MTAVREIALQVFDTRLAAIPGVLEYERMPSADPANFNALHVFDGGQEPLEAESQSSRYAMTVTVEGYVEGYSGAGASAALNALYVDVVTAMMPDPPLGGLAETIDEGGMRVEVAKLADKRHLAFALDFIISFPTRRGDPAQSA